MNKDPESEESESELSTYDRGRQCYAQTPLVSYSRWDKAVSGAGIKPTLQRQISAS